MTTKRPSRKKPIDDTLRGKFTGYHLRDGKYYIAPTYKDDWERTREEQVGIELLLEIVTAHTGKRLTAITAARARWWERLGDDLGVAFRGNGWRYNISEGCIEPIPEAAEKVKP